MKCFKLSGIWLGETAIVTSAMVFGDAKTILGAVVIGGLVAFILTLATLYQHS